MKDTETIVVESEYPDEWYTTWYRCQSCGSDFMVDEAKFCPTCGKKIVGRICGNETVYF